MSTARQARIHPFFDWPAPLAFAHRGFSLEGLENSMAAFAAAVDLGYRYVETDVHVTADGVALAFHDSTLDRVTDRTGAVAALPWQQVRAARIGGAAPIPRLEELLGTWPDLRVNIDAKVAAAVGPLADAIERTRSHHRVCVASFSDLRRKAVLRRLSAPVATSAGVPVVAAFRAATATRVAALSAALLRDVDCLQVPPRFRRVKVVTARVVERVHALGKFVHVWTVNDVAEMRRLLDLGVDGIVTDRADLLRDVLISRGQWPAGPLG